MKQKDDIVCEPARERDVPALVELCLLVERQHEQYWPLRWELCPDIRDRYVRWLTGNLNNPHWLVLAARVRRMVGKASGRAVATLAGGLVAAITQEIPIYTCKEYAFIHDMAVQPEFRRRGVACAMLWYARQWAAKKGVAQLRLMVAQANIPARALFEQAQFRTTYHEMVLPIQ